MKAVNYIGAAKFKEQCLALLDSLDTQGLVITKHGRPVARVIPYPDSPGALIGCLKGKISVDGDLLSTGLSWDANDQS
ncbi:MAG: type II toxin-antitoxin system prevent-host-death family antitoxin [Gammaproteobacteria bacterium]|nr:type II toxin-antitoxin system prevent-host-death family antitoxin [Gammaproteobacteria bacterium]MXZ32209.1 type II toxin-antitoxin system prevent-host-death family antitoxin [Gammaproteobacteria bacterium]MYE98841.1 type II toxin-antitoxin system prevent-host-death family antitoxin [Gammaproteobacteria bacterium]MYG97395.1 type II toxin-antitoxin system prevent-host-death family antitoxin [Gammaproteobacteria bacterium]